jgi:L-ascorbate metabolism protein UlaG (beta-lactamase superfamily)
MTKIRRLTDSCLLVASDSAATLFDPGFHTFGSGEVDLDTIGDVSRVFITHEHGDHAHPRFIAWLLDRGTDIQVFSNEAVAALLAPHDIVVNTSVPEDTSVEDVLHEVIPNGNAPPNRAFTIEDLFTHPGDSRQPSRSGPILALPLLVPWGSTTGAVQFARRLEPRQVIPVHDFYLNEKGRRFITEMAGSVLAEDGIELVKLDWGDSFSF